jgi:ketosteroid isomerase-like protein
MSAERVELVQAMLEGRAPDFRSALAGLPDNVEWVIAKEHPNARTLHGRDEVVAYLEEWAGILDDLAFDVGEYRDAGDRVVVTGISRGRGTGGGVPVEVPLWLVYTFAGDEIVRVEEFLDADGALAAAGLS